MMKNNKLGLYIHIPFCHQKCNYCDFLSFPSDEETRERYIEILCEEIYSCGRAAAAFTVDSVFIGGGTPSILFPKQINRIMTAVSATFTLAKNCEITIEANPGTLTAAKLSTYLEAGINRLSLGVQSMDDGLLNNLGRIHTRRDVIDNYRLARNLGFQNINTDLMFSLPGQSDQQWRETLTEILSMEPEHISFYGLIIEAGTPFYESWEKGLLKETEDEVDRAHYWYTVDRLAQQGYEQYEISNAAKIGYESRHNLKYWSLEPYLGVGLGAHSYLNQARSSNVEDLQQYLQWRTNQQCGPNQPDKSNKQSRLDQQCKLNQRCGSDQTCELDQQLKPIATIHHNSNTEDMEEFLFTGLRKTKGINKTVFQELFHVSIEHVYGSVITAMKEQGLVMQQGDSICLSRPGVDLSNYVMRQFLIDTHEKMNDSAR